MPAKRMEDIAAYMKQMKFRRKTFGGVDEADVWRQLEGLHQEYQAAFDAQWERSRALIDRGAGGGNPQANGEDWQNGRVPW